jgi:alkylated DNA repair dioxygenase AlkB
MNKPDLILDVISKEEEQELLSELNKENIDIVSNKYDRSGLIRYGDSADSSYVKSEVIPKYLIDLSNKLVEQKILDELPASITINVYDKGYSISPHIDRIEYGPVVTILSILSDAELVLLNNSKKINISLPPRSVIQLKGEYRNIWKHSILPVKAKRISIVFRKKINN